MKISTLLIISILFLFNSCGSSEPICECFEVRLQIKELLKSAGGDLGKMKEVSSSDEYNELKEKKKTCASEIEPDYFEKNEINRNGRSDKEFLLDELGDCEAVRILMGE